MFTIYFLKEKMIVSLFSKSKTFIENKNAQSLFSDGLVNTHTTDLYTKLIFFPSSFSGQIRKELFRRLRPLQSLVLTLSCEDSNDQHKNKHREE